MQLQRDCRCQITCTIGLLSPQPLVGVLELGSDWLKLIAQSLDLSGLVSCYLYTIHPIKI